MSPVTPGPPPGLPGGGPVTPGPPPRLSDGTQGAAEGAQEAPLAPVITLIPGHDDGTAGERAGFPVFDAAAILVAVAVGLSPLWSGYYDFGLWAPLALGAVAVLVAVAMGSRPRFTRFGLTAGGALAILLGLSAASMLWAESKDNAWTDSNQLALYAVIFAIGLLAIRNRPTARTIVLILGAPALIASVVIVVRMLTGAGQGEFLAGRLNSPLGYINGSAGLLVMGLWPWIALAETGSRRIVRAGALSAAALIAGTVVLTQSRAIVPATLVATVLVLAAAPQRTRRALHLIVLLVAVALGLHWTLEVYRSSGPTQSLALTDAVLREAALAIIAGAVVAGCLRLALSAISERIAARRRGLVLRRLGQVLLAATAVIVVAGIVAGHSTISTQYSAFVNDRVNTAAPDRFLDAGGFRYDLWRVAVHEFTTHPIGGVGAGNYDTYYYLLRRNPQSVVVPHSLELQMAAELGIGGLIALIVFCGAILAAGFARRRTLAAGEPLVRIAALGLFAAWLTGTSVDWLYNFPGLTGAALLAGALLVVPDPGARAGALRRNGLDEAGAGDSSSGAARTWTNDAYAAPLAARGRRSQAALVLALAALALVAASIGRQYAASRYAASGYAKIDSRDVTGQQAVSAIHTLQTAEQLDPYSLQTLYGIARAYAVLDDYNDAREALLAAQSREPHNYVPPALLGDIASRAGYYRVALAEYSRAESLDPHDPAVQALVEQARGELRAPGSAP
ncbi:MAG: O-antigen ligase family protein [Solirubrobacteraceae bacterium]